MILILLDVQTIISSELTVWIMNIPTSLVEKPNILRINLQMPPNLLALSQPAHRVRIKYNSDVDLIETLFFTRKFQLASSNCSPDGCLNE